MTCRPIRKREVRRRYATPLFGPWPKGMWRRRGQRLEIAADREAFRSWGVEAHSIYTPRVRPPARRSPLPDGLRIRLLDRAWPARRRAIHDDGDGWCL